MAKSLDYYSGLIKENEQEFAERNKLFQKIDDIELCNYTPPAELEHLDWWKTIKVMAPRDALKSASRALATILPKIEIQPLNASEGELDRVDIIERVLEWQFAQMNRRGVRNPLWDIVNSSLKYMMVSFQPVYVPYFMRDRKDDPRMKFISQNGDFVWKVHNPQNVYPRYDDYGLLSVCLKQEMTVDQLKGEYGEHKAIKDLVSDIGDKDNDIGTKRIVFCDYTDWTDRACWLENGGTKYEIERGEHGLPFLNWVIRQGDDPMLKGLIDSGAYEVVNLLASLRYALVLGVVSHPATKSTTFDGQTPEIDNTDPAGNIPLKPGEDIEPMFPRQMDPHLSEILNEQISAIHASTVARALGTLEFSGNMPWATVNAIIQTAVASLAVPRRIAETSIEDGFYLNLNWAKFAGNPMKGYRTSTRKTGVRQKEKGAVVRVMPKEIQASNIIINVELRADTPTDKAERTNRAVNWHNNLNVGLKTCYEEIGIPNFDVQQSEFMQEQMTNSALQNTLYKMSAQAQEELKAQITQQVQQEVMQQMQQAQQGQQGGGMENTNFATTQGQGFNPAEGGQSPYQSAPSQTREEITGQDYAGQEMA
jgi:hypothetical protein